MNEALKKNAMSGVRDYKQKQLHSSGKHRRCALRMGAGKTVTNIFAKGTAQQWKVSKTGFINGAGKTVTTREGKGEKDDKNDNL